MSEIRIVERGKRRERERMDSSEKKVEREKNGRMLNISQEAGKFKKNLFVDRFSAKK